MMNTILRPRQPSPAAMRGSSFLDPQVQGGPMRLADLVEGYWCLTPDMHDEIRAIYATHMRGEKIDVKGIEARLGRDLVSDPQSYTVQDGVAIIPLSGVIAPKANMYTQMCGGTSAQILRSEILAAAADPKVKSGILYADTPGGNVLGTPEAAEAWAYFATQKPAVTYSDGMLASGGYWIGSAAPRIYISGPTVNVGSIGVRTEVVDTSMADAASGVKRTIITAGRYKAAGDGPMSPEAFAYKQGQVDYLYTLFVEHVAQMRGVSVDKVLADMADGRVFIGSQAIDAGLVDGFASLEQLVSALADNPSAVTTLRSSASGSRASSKPATRRSAPTRAALDQVSHVASATASHDDADAAGDAAAALAAAAALSDASARTHDEPVPPVASTTQTHKEDRMTITRETLMQDNPELVAALKSEGAAAERERITSVLALAGKMPGHKALVERLAFDGKTTAPEAAMAVVEAQGQKIEAAAKAHADAAPPAAPVSGGSAEADANALDDKAAKKGAKKAEAKQPDTQSWFQRRGAKAA